MTGQPRPALTTVRQAAQVWASFLAGGRQLPALGVGGPRTARWRVGPVPARAAGGWQATGGVRLLRAPHPAVIGLAQYQPAQGIPLQPANGQGTIASDGTATVRIGPSGLGNIWYPSQATVGTTTSITKGSDSSVCNVYLGPSSSNLTLLGTVYGGGVLSAALPNIQPGQFLIAEWSGATAQDICVLNIQGTMDALA